MPRKRSIDNKSRFISRRQWLTALGISGAAALAGCSGDDDTGDGGDDTGDGGDDMDDTTTTTETETTTTVDELEPSGTYNFVTSAGYETLNPLYNTEAGAGSAIGYTLDQGYTFTDENEYFPLLYDMNTEDGGETWQFEVREGLEFSDPYGEVNAETFVYLVNEVHKSQWAQTAASQTWGGVELEQTGEYTFEATLESANLLWPQTFDPLMYPIPKGLLESYVNRANDIREDTEEGSDARSEQWATVRDELRQDQELLELQFTGNLGGFVLDQWERGAGVTYSRNDNYYIQNIDEGPDLFEGAPYFEGVQGRIVQEQASRLAALETGEADVAAVPPERFEEFDGMDNVDVYQIPQPFNEILAVNMRDNGWNTGPGNLFRYTPFRQALAVAISKQNLIDGVYRGLASPHFTWQPEWSRWYPDSDLPTFGTDDQYGSDPARSLAQEAFDMSEYDYRFDGEDMVGPDGNQVQLDIYHSSGQDTEQLQAEFAAQELGQNLGIDVTVEAIDGRRFGQQYWTQTDFERGVTAEIDGEEVTWNGANPNNPGPRSVTSNEPWDMSMVYGLNTFPRNPLTNQFFFDGPNCFYNPVGYYPDFNAQELFEQARNAESIDELQSAFDEIFVRVAEEQPYIMLVFNDSLTGYNADLVGPMEDFSNGWDFPAWYFEE